MLVTPETRDVPVAALYARVSTDRQAQAQTVASQVAALREQITQLKSQTAELKQRFEEFQAQVQARDPATPKSQPKSAVQRSEADTVSP